jgi:hypothetical protein
MSTHMAICDSSTPSTITRRFAVNWRSSAATSNVLISAKVSDDQAANDRASTAGHVRQHRHDGEEARPLLVDVVRVEQVAVVADQVHDADVLVRPGVLQRAVQQRDGGLHDDRRRSSRHAGQHQRPGPAEQLGRQAGGEQHGGDDERHAQGGAQAVRTPTSPPARSGPGRTPTARSRPAPRRTAAARTHSASPRAARGAVRSRRSADAGRHREPGRSGAPDASCSGQP